MLAGSYSGDTDLGNEFYYSGCGGKDLSGNKRTALQSFDQVTFTLIFAFKAVVNLEVACYKNKS